MGNWKARYAILCQNVYRAVELICCAATTIMIICIAIAVIGRFFFHATPKWTEEFGIVCLIWLCFFSAQLAVYNDSHIRMTLLEYLFPRHLTKKIYKTGYLVILVMDILWIWYGRSIIGLSGMNKLPATGWPIFIEYIPVVLSGIAGVVLTTGRMVKGEMEV